MSSDLFGGVWFNGLAALGEWLPGHLLRGAVVLALGLALVEVAFRWGCAASPRVRQWACGLVLLTAVLPALPPIPLAWLPATESHPVGAAHTTASQAEEPPGAPTTGTADLLAMGAALPRLTEAGQRAAAAPAGATANSVSSWAALPPLLLAFWVAGILAFVIRDACQYLSALCRIARERSLMAEARLPPPDEAALWQAEWRRLAQGQPLPLLFTQSIGPLLAWFPHGYSLLAPYAYWSNLSVAQRRAVLRHEWAHYHRGDIPAGLLVRAVVALFWFHPAAWRLAALFEEAAEWACDQSAAGTDDGLAFASALEQLCNKHSSADTFALGRSAQSHPLVYRVRRLLNPVPSEDSLMKRLLLGAAVGAFVLASLVQFRLVAQEDAAPTLDRVKAEMERLDTALLAIKEQAQAAKEAAQALKEKVEAKIGELKQLVQNQDQLSADAKQRIEKLKSGLPADQLAALDGADKLGDEGLILCAYAAKEAADQAVRRKGLSAAIARGDDGLPVLAFAYESLAADDRLFAAEALVKNKANIHPAVFAKLCGDADERVVAAALPVVLATATPLASVALAAEGNEGLAKAVLAKLDQLAADDQRLALYAGAKKAPEELLPELVAKAAPLKTKAYPIFAAIYQRKTPSSRAALVKLFRNSSAPLEQRLIEEALKDEDPDLRAAAEKARAE